MMADPNIDYTSTNFEYPKLTKIQGIPTYEPLRRIKNELKANAVSVPSDLGRGAHGHLGLMLTVQEYELFTDRLHTTVTSRRFSI